VDDAAVGQHTLDFIKAHRGRLLLHSGGAAAPDGRVVVLHGESGSGKTTLTTALVGEGLSYLTDETVCLDPDTLVVEPFPKPLTVKPGSQEVLARLRPSKDRVDPHSGNWQLDPAVLGGPPIPEVELRPALVVFPDYRPNYAGVEVEPVSRARAAFVLGEQSSSLWAVQPRPLAALVRLVTEAPAFQATYGDAHNAAPVIVAHLLRSTVPVERSDVPAAVPTVGAELRWADHADWVGLDGEVVVFDGSHLHHLDIPGAAIWTRLDGSRDLATITEEVAEGFEADPNAVRLDVEDLVRVLRRNGLLVE
jgi:energy-coupling factor transporter ATP-binding protein EcfA2